MTPATRSALAIVGAIALGLALGSIPYCSYRFGGHHHDGSAHTHAAPHAPVGPRDAH